MKTLLKLWFSGLAALALASCSPALDSGSGSLSQAGNPKATALFSDVNRYRASVGKPALTRHQGLDRLAQGHSEFMMRNRGKFKFSKSGNVSHDGFESRAAIARHKYGMSNIHENIAAGPRGSSMARTWIDSRGHEPAMRDDWSYTGVGVAVDQDGYIFATQIFANTASRPMLRERFGSN